VECADSVVLTPPAIEVAPWAFIWRLNGWAEVPLGKMNLKDEIKIEQVNRDRIQERLTFNMAITAPTFSQRGLYYLDLSFRSNESEEIGNLRILLERN
jgi:hypothetical protein